MGFEIGSTHVFAANLFVPGGGAADASARRSPAGRSVRLLGGGLVPRSLSSGHRIFFRDLQMGRDD